MTEAEFWDVVVQILLFALLITGAVTDLMYRKVFNWLTFPVIAMGLTMAVVVGGPSKFVNHLFYAVIPTAIVFAIYVAKRYLGAGDLKLMVAIAALKGFPFIIPAFFWSSVIGAIMAVGMLIWTGQLGAGLKRTAYLGLTMKGPDPDGPEALKIPYGVAISFGTMIAWFLDNFGGQI